MQEFAYFQEQDSEQFAFYEIKNAACLLGQAAFSALITVMCLVIPRLAGRHLGSDIHLIRSYEGIH